MSEVDKLIEFVLLKSNFKLPHFYDSLCCLALEARDELASELSGSEKTPTNNAMPKLPDIKDLSEPAPYQDAHRATAYQAGMCRMYHIVAGKIGNS